MNDDYSINVADLDLLHNVGEFEVWLWMLDDQVDFISIDPLIEFLDSNYHRPEFTIAAIKYKQENNL